MSLHCSRRTGSSALPAHTAGGLCQAKGHVAGLAAPAECSNQGSWYGEGLGNQMWHRIDQCQVMNFHEFSTQPMTHVVEFPQNFQDMS